MTTCCDIQHDLFTIYSCMHWRECFEDWNRCPFLAGVKHASMYQWWQDRPYADMKRMYNISYNFSAVYVNYMVIL